MTTVFNPRAVLCCIMSLLLPASTLPAQNAPAGGAILSPSGLVTINNNDIGKNSSALLGNETIATGPQSAAHITSPGSDTLVAASTIATYERDSIELKSGLIVITTNNGTFARVGKLKFAAANQGTLTKFEVQKDGCDVTVTARSKSVALPDGQVLDEGRSARSTDRDCACAAGALDRRRDPLSTLPPQNVPLGGAVLSTYGLVTINRDLVRNSSPCAAPKRLAPGRTRLPISLHLDLTRCWPPVLSRPITVTWS